jgi:hypothetical protein
VGGGKYGRDLVLFPDGTPRRRKGGSRVFGSHSFKKREVEVLVTQERRP